MLSERARDQGGVQGHIRMWMNVFPFSCHPYNRFDRLKRVLLNKEKGSLSIFGLTEREMTKESKKREAGVFLSLHRFFYEGLQFGQAALSFFIVTLFLFELRQSNPKHV